MSTQSRATSPWWLRLTGFIGAGFIDTGFIDTGFIDTGFIDTINQRVGVYASWPILAMTLINAANAVSRKAIRVSSIAFPEMQWYRIAESSFSNFMTGRQLPFR
jgi:hypothetical protein